MATPDAQPLDRLFNADSVAIVGASADPGKHTHRPLEALRRFGFKGDVLPVNPAYEKIDDLVCYPTLNSLPAPPDVALICRPAADVPRLLKECSDTGVGFAVVYSSGFGEAGADGHELQRSLAGIGGTRVIGPNSLGFIAAHSGVALSISSAALAPTPRVDPGAVALISQSGGLMSMTQELMADRGLGISWAVSTGNEADLSVVDFLNHAVRDPATDTVLLVIEGIRPEGLLTEALSALQQAGKRVIALKLGVSEGGSRGVVTHTGRLTSGAAAWRGLFAQYGVSHVADPNALADAAAASTATAARPRGSAGVAVISNSGGGAALLADAVSDAGLPVPELRTETAAALAGVVPALVHPSNPLDLTSQGYTAAILESSIQAMASQPDVEGVVLGLSMTAVRNHVVLDAIAAASRTCDVPVVAVTLTGDSGSTAAAALRSGGVPVFESPSAAGRALATALRSTSPSVPTSGSAASPPSPVPAAALAALESGGALNEFESGDLLSAAGLRVARRAVATSPADAAAAAERIGYPVVVKVLSADILHKAAAGGVVLNVTSKDDVIAAFARVVEAAGTHAPTARLDGVLVQEQVPPGAETLLGVRRDPDLGLTITVGVGGALVEKVNRVAVGVLPLRPGDAEALVDRSGVVDYVHPAGVQGDREALIGAVARMAVLAGSAGTLLEEVDANPVLVSRGEAIVVDAVVVSSAASATHPDEPA